MTFLSQRCMCGMELLPGEHCTRTPCVAVTLAAGHSMPRGCICPPGANKDCENQFCPRKPLPLPSAPMRTEGER